MVKQIVSVAAAALVFVSLMDKVGFNTKRLFGLKSFAQNKPDFKINRIYGFDVFGGLSGYARFYIDVDVINKSQSDVLLSNILVTAYNEKGEYIGQSVPYAGDVVIRENNVTTIPQIEVHAQFAKVLFGYGIPAIVQIIQNKSWQNVKLGKKIKLDVSLELNGVKINKQTDLDI